MSNVIEATIKQAGKVLYGNVLAGIPTILLSQPGGGKTSICRAVRAAIRTFDGDGGYSELSTAKHNPIELGGLWRVDGDRTNRYPTGLVNLDRPTFVMVDELGDCPRHEQSGWYELFLEHKVGDRKLAPGSYVCAASNRPEDSAAAKKLSTALLGRACVVMIRPDVGDLVEFAHKDNWPQVLISFMRAYGDKYIVNGFDTDCPFAGSTARDFSRVAKLELSGALSKQPAIAELQVCGNIGPDAGLTYLAFKALELPDPGLVFSSPLTAPVLDSLELQTAYNGAIVNYASGSGSGSDFKALTAYGMRLDRVTGFGLFFDASRRHKEYRSHPAFVEPAQRYIELLT